MNALREIRRFQKSTELLLLRRPFARIIREIISMIAPRDNLRIQATALQALQEAAEHVLVTEFQCKPS